MPQLTPGSSELIWNTIFETKICYYLKTRSLTDS